MSVGAIHTFIGPHTYGAGCHEGRLDLARVQLVGLLERMPNGPVVLTDLRGLYRCGEVKLVGFP